jgi:hypothetical protein
MQVQLPSGAVADIRTALKAKDKFAVQRAISADGEQTGGVLSLMQAALMARIVESWTLDVPLPSQHACTECTGSSARWHEHVRDEFGELDIDDFNKLQEVTTPLLQKVIEVPNLETSPASAASS